MGIALGTCNLGSTPTCRRVKSNGAKTMCNYFNWLRKTKGLNICVRKLTCNYKSEDRFVYWEMEHFNKKWTNLYYKSNKYSLNSTIPGSHPKYCWPKYAVPPEEARIWPPLSSKQGPQKSCSGILGNLHFEVLVVTGYVLGKAHGWGHSQHKGPRIRP